MKKWQSVNSSVRKSTDAVYLCGSKHDTKCLEEQHLGSQVPDIIATFLRKTFTIKTTFISLDIIPEKQHLSASYQLHRFRPTRPPSPTSWLQLALSRC